jgi:rhomboid protease GluP
VFIEVKRGRHVQQMLYEDFEQRILDGEIDERTLVRFPEVTGESFRPAGELELVAAIADPGRAAFRRRLTEPGVPIITALLVGVQVRLFMLSQVPVRRDWLQQHLTNWAPMLYEAQEVWRLLAYGLLQTTLTHLAMNLLFLAYTGYHLERSLGRRNLLVVFFASVFVGGLLSMGFGPFKQSLGSSGGVFGLIAASIVVGWKHWDDLPQRARRYFGWALIPYLVLSLFSGLQNPQVDNWSHLGGMATGAVLATLLQPEALERSRTHNRVVRGLSLGLMGAVMLGLAVAGTRAIPLVAVESEGWTVAQPAYWRDYWTFIGDRGVSSIVHDAALGRSRVDYPRPLGPDAAADELLQRVGASAQGVELLDRQPATLDGVEGRRLRLRYVYAETPFVMDALVLVRGLTIHWVWLSVPAPEVDRYAGLFDRALAEATLPEPPELAAARERVSAHPRSVEPAVTYADALYKVGQPAAALAEYDRALGIFAGAPSAWLGKLRTVRDYGLDGGPALAREALRVGAEEPEVIVEAVSLLEQAGLRDEAVAALDEAWARRPNDRALRRARNRMGLSVSLPPAPAGAAAGGP